MQRGKTLLILFSIIFLSSLASAITCNPSSISWNYNQGSLTTQNTLCNNTGNSSVSISLSGSYLFLNESSIPASSLTMIRVTFDANAPLGSHSGSINFGDSTSVPIAFSVSSPPTLPSSCSINIFPTTLQNVKIQQGEIKTRTITLSVPACFSSPVTVQGISLQADEKPIQLGELSAGTLQPGQSLTIPIDINAQNVAIGTYSDIMQYLLYNSSGFSINVPNTDISVIVSSGISPITNFSVTQLPTCSLSSLTLTLNSTYTLTCGKNNPNIKIEPDINPFYLVGISDTSTSTQFIYNFKAKNIGSTLFRAKFKYDLSPIGEPFEQELKISSGGANSGTVLDFIFYQNGVPKNFSFLKGGEAIIQLIDNETKSLVTNSEIYLNGLLVNGTINLIPNQTYELRGKSSGYEDRIINLAVTENAFGISLNKTSFSIGEQLFITSNISGVSYYLNDTAIILPYILNSPGGFKLDIRKDGYETISYNISVSNTISVIEPLPPEVWNLKDEIFINLNQPSQFVVERISPSEDENGNLVYNTIPEVVKRGEGSSIDFKISKLGKYDVKVDGTVLLSREVKESFWGRIPFWGKSGIILFSIFLILIGYMRVKSNKNKNEIDDVVGAG